MTARNRELGGVLVAGLIAGTALASITIARESEISPRAIGYGLVFLGLYLAAHIVVRRTAPYADGALLPLTAVLTAFGLALNYRLDPDDGGRQALWVLIGVGVFAVTLIALRHDYRVLESYRYLFGVAAVFLLLLPSVPGLGERVNGVKLWVAVGPLQFQPGELAKIFLILFLAGYLREKREVLAQGRLKDFGPLLAIWGAAMLVIVQTNDLGKRAPQLRDLPRDVVRRNREGALRRRRDWLSSSAELRFSTTPSTGCTSGSPSGSSPGPTSACSVR